MGGRRGGGGGTRYRLSGRSVGNRPRRRDSVSVHVMRGGRINTTWVRPRGIWVPPLRWMRRRGWMGINAHLSLAPSVIARAR